MYGALLLFALGAGINFFVRSNRSDPCFAALLRRRRIAPTPIRSILDRQSSSDHLNAASVPSLIDSDIYGETVPIEGESVQLILGGEITNTKLSTVFNLNTPNLVIKYQVDCSWNNDHWMHPLVREFGMMSNRLVRGREVGLCWFRGKCAIHGNGKRTRYP